MKRELVRESKFLSLVLRHRPETIGLELDEGGWADVESLLDLANADGRSWTRELLEQVVATNDKQRFRFSPDRRRIRASQGHSLAVDLQLAPREPPAVLFHGAALRFLASIMTAGLQRRSRRHVHLSSNRETAESVGARHGKPVVLAVDAARMAAEGRQFFLSDNQVWLTDEVPPHFLQRPAHVD